MKTNCTLPNKVTAADLEQFRNSGKTVTAPFRDLNNSADVALLLSSKQSSEGQAWDFDRRVREEVANSVCYRHMIADAIEEIFFHNEEDKLDVKAVAFTLEWLIGDVRMGCMIEQSMNATNKQFLANLKIREAVRQEAN